MYFRPAQNQSKNKFSAWFRHGQLHFAKSQNTKLFKIHLILWEWKVRHDLWRWKTRLNCVNCYCSFAPAHAYSLGDTVTTGAGCTCMPPCSTNYKYQEFSIAARSIWICRVQCLIFLSWCFLAFSCIFYFWISVTY